MNFKITKGCILASLMCLAGASGASAETSETDKSNGAWEVYGGLNLTHSKWDAEGVNAWDPYYIQGSGTGVGFFVGGARKVRLSPFWSLTPAVELEYISDNSSYNSSLVYLNSEAKESYLHLNSYLYRTWNITIPVLIDLHAPVSKSVNIGFGIGPFVSCGFVETTFDKEKQAYTKTSIGSDRWSVGAIGRVVVESGKHLSYFLRLRYPMYGGVQPSGSYTFSIGVGYTF